MTRHFTSAILLLFVITASATTSSAQTPAPDSSTVQPSLRLLSRGTIPASVWVEKPSIVMPLSNLFTIGGDEGAQPSRNAFAERRRPVGRKILGGVLGGVGGFFAGGFIGAKLEPDCNCDDPGFKGFLIGAPVGAVAGAIAGVFLAAR